MRVADFVFYEMTEKMLAIDPEFPDKYPLFMDLRRNFEAIPRIKTYMQSGDFVPLLFPPGLSAVNTKLK